MAAGVLILGVGNPLRGDDGVGPAIVDRLVSALAPGEAELCAVHQLTPELAGEFAAAGLVVVVDAAADVTPGQVVVRPLAGVHVVGEPFSHAVDPAGLAGLARVLYGSAPSVVLVEVGAASFDAGAGLSPAVASALDQAVATVTALVGEA